MWIFFRTQVGLRESSMRLARAKLSRALSLVLISSTLPFVLIATSLDSAVAAPGAFHINPSAHEPYVMPYGHLNITLSDLQYILDQIKIGEAHAARTAATTADLYNGGSTPANASSNIIYPYDVSSANRCLTSADLLAAAAKKTPTPLSDAYPFNVEYPWGLRQVDGQCNNIHNVAAETPVSKVYSTPVKATDPAGWGAADQLFPRLAPSALQPSPGYTLSPAQNAYKNPNQSVRDPSSRVISNIISDQSIKNPAAVSAGKVAVNTLYGTSTPQTEYSVNAGTGAVTTVVKIPNVTADYNVSAGFNSWFTLFGQFFDHGLDLIPKAGKSVLIPLKQDDPLYVASPSAPNFMVLTRGADGSTGESINTTTPYVDQSQTYGSHPSQNFFLREYSFAAGTGTPVSTGRLIEGTDLSYPALLSRITSVRSAGGTLTHPNGGADSGNNGLATWKEIKAQARLLGFDLTDYDARSIPVIATDQYGKFIKGKNNFPMMLFTDGNNYVWAEGDPTHPLGTGAKTSTDPLGGTALPGRSGSWVAVSTGHAFLNDTMASAVPFSNSGTPLTPDADSIMNSSNVMPNGYYDNENLDAHYIAGDGRVNENIGLSAVHHIFHSEHNLLVQDITDLLNNDPAVTAAFKSEWTGNGERLYQAARLINEMEYQHMVYDEFIRRIAPSLPLFTQYDPNLNADIPAEFASAVYRLGHSMLDETIARSNPGAYYDPNNNQDVSLLTGFTNPAQARLSRPMTVSKASWSGSTMIFTLSPGETAPPIGSIVSVSEMDSSDFNINSAVVDSIGSATSPDGPTFTVHTYYAGDSSSTATNLPTSSLSLQTSVSRLAPDGSSKIAYVAINDPMTSGFQYSPGTSAAMIAQGMSSQRGNEIDEFVTDAVRNNLLGLPLDLASLNITRGRDVGLPTLNQFRKLNSASLTPYTSWRDFISKLRNPESGINFVAAYGTHSTLTAPVTIANITEAATSTINSKLSVTYTYTAASGKSVNVGDVVTISGFTNAAFNLANAVVSSATSNTFVVNSTLSHAPSAIVAYNDNASMYADGPSPLTGISGSVTGTASAKRDPNVDEKRLAAAALVSSTMSVESTYPAGTLPAVPADATDFMNSSGSYWASHESGLNNVDLWIGGLAENPAKQPITPPMLGTTFQFVFENVSLKLQNGDRFYYLSRLMGKNLGEEIPAQKLTDIVRRNTPSASATTALSGASGIIGMNSPGFSISDCAFGSAADLIPSSVACAANSVRIDPTTNAIIHDGIDNVTGFADPSSSTGVKITSGGGDDAVFGSSGNDILSGGIGGDLIDGGAGNDIIFGGAGEDIIKGGPGNDVINTGDNQIGEIADGGSGDDFIHSGNATGFANSLFGETGNDFIQGTSNLDIFLGGGEGDDWIEGGGDQENAIYGDSGPTFAAQQPTLGPGLVTGGNDVLNGGPGYDVLFGNGGDDIFLAGDGIDTLQGDGGFDWLDYEQNVRFDNGQANLPGVFMDLSGTVANPVAGTTEDQVTDVEGLSGSSGNDVLTGRLANDVTVARVITGVAGGTTLVMPGTITGIDAGMRVTGNGIGLYATTVAIARTSTVNGSTVTTVDLTDQNTANVTGPVTFSVWPLEHPELITGLSGILSNTPGWTKHLVNAPSATIWSGGTILLGGDGNDVLRPISGENVLHGSAYLHTCIKVTRSGFADTGADVNCAGGRGYSSMTPLGPLMDDGTLTPSDLSIVREIVSTAVSITGYTATGTSITYTSNNHFMVGESVSISGISNSRYNIVNAIVTAADATSFTIASSAPTGSSTSENQASAVATDTVALAGTVDQYAIVPFTPLPAGVTSAYKIISKDGSIDIVFDIQMVSFAGAAAVPIAGSAPALTSLTFSTGTLTPTFAPNTLSYGLEVAHLPSDVTSVTLTAVSAAVGAGIKYRLGTTGTFTNVNSNTPFTVSGLSTSGNSTIEVVVSNGSTSSTYSILVTHSGLVPAIDEITSTSNQVALSVTNYDSNFSYTATVVTSTPHIPAVTATLGSPSGGKLPITITNLLPTETATVTVSTSRAGFTNAASSKGVAAQAGGALVALFGNVVPTSTGFTVPITNFDSNYTIAVTSSAGVVTQGTASGSTLTLTVTGLSTGQSATLTVVSSRAGYGNATATVVGATTSAPGLTPVLSTPVSTADGFTFNVTNYDQSFTYISTNTNGAVAMGIPNGRVLPFTVSGLQPGAGSTVMITTTQLGHASSNATVTANANPLLLPQTALRMAGSPTSATVGTPISLSITSGGSGTGALIFVTSTQGCTISTNILNASVATGCLVTATKDADSTYSSANVSATFVFTNVVDPGSFAFTNGTSSVTGGTTVTLIAAGGAGSGKISYSTQSAGCVIRGALLSVTTAPVDCLVTATKANSPTPLTATKSFTFTQRPQAVLRITNTKTTGLSHNSRVTLSAAGGSGAGVLTYSVTGSYCTILGSNLTASQATTCVVTATKSASTIYQDVTSSAVSFIFTS